MIDLIKIDPFLYGYFENEALEHGERVGLALLCAAKNLEIKFSRHRGFRWRRFRLDENQRRHPKVPSSDSSSLSLLTDI